MHPPREDRYVIREHAGWISMSYDVVDTVTGATIGHGLSTLLSAQQLVAACQDPRGPLDDGNWPWA